MQCKLPKKWCIAACLDCRKAWVPKMVFPFHTLFLLVVIVCTFLCNLPIQQFAIILMTLLVAVSAHLQWRRLMRYLVPVLWLIVFTIGLNLIPGIRRWNSWQEPVNLSLRIIAIALGAGIFNLTTSPERVTRELTGLLGWLRFLGCPTQRWFRTLERIQAAVPIVVEKIGHAVKPGKNFRKRAADTIVDIVEKAEKGDTRGAKPLLSGVWGVLREAVAIRRIAVTLCYDGTNYCGWQKQGGRRGVAGGGARKSRKQAIQEVFEDAVEKIFRERVKVTGASRTDAGVHALGQVAHFDVRADRPETGRIPVALNSVLPSGIRVISACETSLNFSARFSARNKRYRYIIENTPTPTPFLNHYVWHIRSPLNISAMKKAARLLKGRRDWTSFAASQDERKNHTCRVSRLSIRTARNAGLMLPQSVQDPDLKCKGLVIVEIEADFFLYHMVRNIVGTLIEVGRGRIPLSRVKTILPSRDRRAAGPTAPPHGLYLVKVKYGSQVS